jgi:hypothetical protein
MAHLWTQDSQGEWAVLLLEDATVDLSQNPPRRLRSRSISAQPEVRLFRPSADERSHQGPWLLLSAPTRDVQVNGLPLARGLWVLADRDEIRVSGAGTFFFSTEELPRLEPFVGDPDKLTYCYRCKEPIEPGSPAVRCPSCSLYCHQNEEVKRGCWLYDGQCPYCKRPTDLDSGFSWTPEHL